ncbi:hypothetical protein MHU86_6344 [Fragilaria crotonensis]|nr:hypothetical protein MHU86_6344 [Fragilaria crotonensis]
MSTSESVRERIVCPQRVINGGVDFKFETDPYNVKLYNLMPATEYTDAMTKINDTLKPSRAKKIDTVLLETGVLMVPLAIWGVRHGMQAKKRKRLLKKAIQDFNATHPALHMRWNRRPDSSLTIERRREELHGVPPPHVALAENETVVSSLHPPGVVDEHTPLVYAQVSNHEPDLLV